MLRVLPRVVLRAALPRHAQVCATLPQHFHTSNVLMEDYMRGGRGRGRGRGKAVTRAPPPPAAASDPWMQVKDDASGQMYWWNQDTNEVT